MSLSLQQITKKLAGRPHPRTFQQVLQALDAMPDPEVLDLLPSLTSLLAHWPARLREAPADVLDAVWDNQAPAWWPLVTAVKLNAYQSLSITAGMADIRTFSFGGCVDAWELPQLAGLPLLEELDLSRLEGLETIDSLPVLKHLVTLKLSNCPHLVSVADASRQPSLTALDLTFSPSCFDLQTVSALPLRRLSLSHSKHLSDLSALAKLTGLTRLDLRNLPKLRSLEFLRALAGLESLDLSDCEAVEALDTIGDLSMLTALYLSGSAIGDLRALKSCQRLTKLNLAWSGPVELSPLETLSGLHELFLKEASSADLGHQLAGLTTLKKLVVEEAAGIGTLDFVRHMPALNRLQLRTCEGLVELGDMGAATALEVVVLQDCPRAKTKSLLSAPNLKTVNLAGTPVDDDIVEVLRGRGVKVTR